MIATAPRATPERATLLSEIAALEIRVWPKLDDRSVGGKVIRIFQRLPRTLEACNEQQLEAYRLTLHDYLESH